MIGEEESGEEKLVDLDPKVIEDDGLSIFWMEDSLETSSMANLSEGISIFLD